MTNEELYDAALREYQGGGLQAWLAGQHDDTLFRLYAGLAEYRQRTLVVRTTGDLARGETHDGPLVFRDDRKDWFPYCDDMCILGDVTDLLGQRLYAALRSDDRDKMARADLPDARRVLSDWLGIVEDRLGQPGGPPGVDFTYACESRLVRTSGMARHGLPELGIRDVPLYLGGTVGRFLLDVSAQVLARPGDARLGEMMCVSNGVQFRFVPADPPGRDEYRPSELWRLADVGEPCHGCGQSVGDGG